MNIKYSGIRVILSLAILAISMAGIAAAPAITVVSLLYAAPGGASSGTCDSWGSACELQYALLVASTDSFDDEVWVKQGTYYPTSTSDRTVSFIMKNGVSLYGGFAGTESTRSQRNWVTSVTILSGEIGNLGTKTDNSYHVAYASGANSSAVLDGFTIQDGYADGSASPELFGGGIYISGGSPTLANLIIINNYAADTGGGVFNLSSTSAFTNVTFRNNNSYSSGGGMENESSNPSLTEVIFDGNSSTSGFGGGGMFNYQSSPTITNATFKENSADGLGAGGGMFNYDNSNPTVKDVTFLGNSAYGGGGIYNFKSNLTMIDATFSGNSDSFGAAAMYNDTSNPVLTNLTFSGNSESSGTAAMYNDTSNPIINDSIFWNDNSEFDGASSAPTITDSLIAGGCPVGATCSGAIITTDPLLGSLSNNGGFSQTMSLGLGSPAIDAGNDSTCASTDQRGIPRPQGSHCDIGAYEAQYMVFHSSGSQDGWVLESGEKTNVGGGSPNSSGSTFTLGDNPSRKQYRSFLSFNTSSLPDNAAISSVTLKLKYSSVVPPPSHPITLLHGILFDVKKGFFGSTSSLQTTDFQAPTTKTVGPFSPALSGGLFYEITLGSSAFPAINNLTTNGGLTQIRLRFKLDDNNNSIANTLNLISGNNPTASNRPTLIVFYYSP